MYNYHKNPTNYDSNMTEIIITIIFTIGSNKYFAIFVHQNISTVNSINISGVIF